MPRNPLVLAATLALLGGAAPPASAVDLSFMDQAPVRFLNTADTDLMSQTVDVVLNDAKDGESRTWEGTERGTSGTITAVRSFEEKGLSCRRISMLTLARRATRGRSESLMDFCKIDGDWKILRMP
jgi:surface antigen